MKLTFSQFYVLLCSIGAFTLYTLSWWFNKPLNIYDLFIGVFAVAALGYHALESFKRNGNGKS